MVGVTGVFLCVIITCSGLVVTSTCMVELRRRKNKRDNDDNSFAPSSSQSDEGVSDDDLEEETKSKRKKDIETKSKKKNTSNQGPHKCRFCPEVFTLSQALGGHMNKHRSEKEHEEVQKARLLIAKKQPYIIGNSWNMPGDCDGNIYGETPSGNSLALGTSSRVYFNYHNQPASTLQNSQMNQVFAAQHNVCSAIPPLQGRGYNYNSVDDTRSQVYGLTSQRKANPTGQYQAQHGRGANSGQQYPVQTVFSDSKPMQPQYGSVLHSNQGGLQDIVNMASHNQGQSNILMASFIHTQPSIGERTQFVDEHGNPAPDYQAGHILQMPQDYTQTSLDQKLGTSMDGLRSESSGIGSEHKQAPAHGVFGMPSLNSDQDFQGGTDQNTALMESGQGGFETDTSIGDHNSARLQ